MSRELTPAQAAERSLLKTYRETLWNPFVGAVKQYRLIAEGDAVAVCVSGGKDSLVLCKLMQLLCRHSEVPFTVTFIAMDPGFTPAVRRQLEENARLLEIPLTVFETDVLRVAEHHGGASPCYLCARMRRGYLYAKAKELGCNKIALGHHRDDAIETTLIGMLYGSQLQGMLPRLRSTNFPGMELIRPLYAIREADIIRWQNYNHLAPSVCACPVAVKNAADGEDGSRRQTVKRLIAQLKKDDPNVENSLFHSLHKVNANTFPGYRLGEVEHSFLERFEESLPPVE